MKALSSCKMRILNALTVRCLLFLAAFASMCFLGFALISQYGFGLFPCELCIAQRVPYALIIGLGVLVVWFRNPRVMLGLAYACVLLFVVDAGIAFYHTAVELHWVAGPSACTSSTEPQTLEEMRAAIMNAALVSCDQPMAHVLGLSMAGWNGVAATVCALLMWLGLKQVKRKGARV